MSTPNDIPAPGPPWWKAALRRAGIELAKAIAMTLVCAGIAIAVNAVRGRDGGGIDLFARAPYDIYTDCPEMDTSLPRVTVADLPAKPGPWVIYVDARPSAKYLAGHIPGAHSLPMYGTRPNAPHGLAFLRPAWGRVLVVYGQDEMQSALHLASWLHLEKGKRPFLLKGDLPAWTAAGRPLSSRSIPKVTAAAARPAQDALVVDARPRAQFAQGHVPGALSVPFNGRVPPNAAAFARLLQSKRPLIIYGVEGVDEELADPEKPSQRKDVGRLLAAELLALGARRVSFMPGGLGSWEDAGGKTETAPAPRPGGPR